MGQDVLAKAKLRTDPSRIALTTGSRGLMLLTVAPTEMKNLRNVYDTHAFFLDRARTW
jgi:hypothetical protein